MTGVSVIIPVYNAEKYLKRCLDSVISQTFKDIEIICVNDGSTDDSIKILDEYRTADARIVVSNQRENKGVGASRNAGLNIARGMYISFIDADDWINPDFLEKLYTAAEKYEADAVCSEIIRAYPSGRMIKKAEIEKEEVLYTCNEKCQKLEIPKNCYVWNKFYRKSELDRHKLQFEEKLSMCEDVNFTIRFLCFSNKVVTVPGARYYYWVSDKSASRTASDKNQIDKLAARADFIKFSRDHHIICDEKFYVKDKIFYKFFGIPILKIYEWETVKKYYLFGVIPFFEKRISL